MNILEVEDMIKGLPDQALQQEAQAPTGQVPQFLVVSEIQRRTDMRKRYQQQQEQPQGTVAEQIVQEGIAGISPQMGMPPQAMPQGMPPQGMPPQGMPPQQMFSGGIIRLREGGETPSERLVKAIDMLAQKITPVQLVSMGYTEEEIVRASQLLKERMGMSVGDFQTPEQQISSPERRPDNFQRDFPVVPGLDVDMSSLSQQMNMPNYSMIAPAGVGDLPSLPDLAQTDVKLPDRRRGEGVGSARESYIPQEINLPSGTNLLSSVAEGWRQTPFDKYSRAAEQGIMDVYEKDGLAAGIGEFGRGILGGLLSLGETAVEGYKPTAKMLAGATDYLTSGPARALDQFLTGSTEDPLTLGDIAGYFSGGPQERDLDQLQEVTVDAKAREYAPELKALLDAAQAGTQDASKKRDGVGLLYDDDGIFKMPSGTGSKEVQGTSPRQNQARPNKTEPSLDFADLIAESKQAGMANALMQLGAGIAGGDLSKGISAAGIAATKGQQDAKAIAMRQRLAEYQAGREDIARGEKGRQFDKEMDLLEKRVKATLTASSATSQRENLRALAGEVASLRENFAIMSDAERARFRVLEQQLYSMLGISMPEGDVGAGIPTGESEWGIASRQPSSR